MISKLDYKDGYVKDVSISRDGVIVSNELIKKTVKKEGYEIVNSVEIGTDRFAFKILKKPKSLPDSYIPIDGVCLQYFNEINKRFCQNTPNRN